MKADRQTQLDVERSMLLIRQEMKELGLKKQELQVKNNAYTGRIRGNMLPPEEYKSIVRKKQENLKEMLAIEKKLNEKKLELSRREILKESIKAEIKGDAVNNDGAMALLRNIGEKYRAFSSDSTRISSMRLMASQFTEEIDLVISALKRAENS